MFESDYTLIGKHATYTKRLNEAGVFARYIDVYMNAAILGFLYGRKAERDHTSNDRGRIYADAFIRERTCCIFIFQLIMLLEQTTGYSEEERVDRVFREMYSNEDVEAKNLELFHQYVRGRIEYLHEFFEDCSATHDYVSRMYDLVSDFKEELDGISYSERLEEVIGEYVVG